MRAHPLFESVPNFSEGTRGEIVAAFAGAAALAHVLDVDADVDHNRVVVSLAGNASHVVDALLASVEVAIDHIDLREHRGVHPRVGAADVLPIVPLGDAKLAGAHELARELGERVWNEQHVPVYFYGHGEPHTLADIRARRVTPDLGGPDLHESAGAVCIGARPPLLAFNVLLPGAPPEAARALARSLREANGGLRGVQALAFMLPGGVMQLSMNLFRLEETPPAAVIAELEQRGVVIGPQQVIGLCPAAAANDAAGGRLLEGRLAAAAARRGAELCAAQGDDEHLRLAVRLEQVAGQLAGSGIDQEELLAGAERATALIGVLVAAGVLDHELRTMLECAARGLRSALLYPTLSHYPARIEALDEKLEAKD
ncbi:MAG TPA: glutamate formiminotransferase [Candidatus Dormibacteraeota bacterium]